MTYVVEVLRQEHRNIEKLLRVLERELSVFDRGDAQTTRWSWVSLTTSKTIRIHATIRRRT